MGKNPGSKHRALPGDPFAKYLPFGCINSGRFGEQLGNLVHLQSRHVHFPEDSKLSNLSAGYHWLLRNPADSCPGEIWCERYVCVRLCMCVCVHEHVKVWTHVWECACMLACMIVCMCIYMCVCVRTSGGSSKGWDKEFRPPGALGSHAASQQDSQDPAALGGLHLCLLGSSVQPVGTSPSLV